MSLSCNETRLRLPFTEEAEPDSQFEEHLIHCASCRRLAGWHERLDRTLRNELVTAAPPELTTRLLAVVPAVAAGRPIRTRRWQRQRTIAALIASVLIGISATLLALGLSWISHAIGADQIMASVQGWPALLIALLYTWLPQSQYVVEVLLQLQEPLQWLIVSLLLWRAFERFRAPHELSSTSA